MTDHNKPIPKTDFPYGLMITGVPSAEPLVYLDDDFDCDPAYYYHCSETGGRPVPGSSPSIMARKTVREMLRRADREQQELLAGQRGSFEACEEIAVRVLKQR